MKMTTMDWRLLTVWTVCLAFAMLVFAMLALKDHPLHAEPAPYQAYKISYGCLYVVGTGSMGGGIAAVVTPSVQGQCR